MTKSPTPLEVEARRVMLTLMETCAGVGRGARGQLKAQHLSLGVLTPSELEVVDDVLTEKTMRLARKVAHLDCELDYNRELLREVRRRLCDGGADGSKEGDDVPTLMLLEEGAVSPFMSTPRKEPLVARPTTAPLTAPVKIYPYQSLIMGAMWPAGVVPSRRELHLSDSEFGRVLGV